MKILCWNTDDAVWEHWNKIVDSEMTRVSSFSELKQSLTVNSFTFNYCFIYIANKDLVAQVEDILLVCNTFPELKIIVFPSNINQLASLRLFSAGISGLCAPYIGEQQLGLVLSVVDSGEIWGGKAFIQQLIQSASSADHYANELDELSERELSVANFIAKGLSNKQIANEMDITERTVKAHLTSIFKKTETKDRLALALLVQNSHTVH